MRQHIQRSVELPASVPDVWAAVTEADRLGDWLGGVTDLEPILDSTFTFVDESGARHGVVLDVVDHARIRFWWASDDAEEGSVVTIELDPGPDSVLLSVHETPARLVDGTAAAFRVDEVAVAEPTPSRSVPVGFQPPTLSRAI